MLPSPELLLLAAALMHPIIAQSPVHVVNGVVGKPVKFSVNINISFGETVERIEWAFLSKPGPERIFLEFKDGEMRRVNPEDRFGQRLEIINETTLGIQELEMEDGGQYTARVRFSGGIHDTQTFSLKVFDPVPQPQIHLEQVSRSLHGCNVTLQCLAPGKGRFNLSWKTGDPLQDLEARSDWHRLSPNGSALSLSWQPGSLDNTFTCLISNPADQKSTTSDIRSICESPSSERATRPMAWLVLPVLITFAVLGCVIWKKKQKLLLSTAAPSSSSSSSSSSSPNPKLAVPPDSATAQRRSPPEGDDEQELEQLSEQDDGEKPPTVYAKLQRPTHTFDQLTS